MPKFNSVAINSEYDLTEDEERKMDLISNAIIDIILSNPAKYTKIPLSYCEKSNNLIVKDRMR